MSDEECAQWYDEHAWRPDRLGDLTLVTNDLSPAQWIELRLVPRSFEVRMTVPQGYEAYARIFFPFRRTGIDESGEWFEEHVRWTDLAAENVRVAHPLMEQETISTPPSGEAATDGQLSWKLSPAQFETLLPVLSQHTLSDRGWFLLWDGFGDLNREVLHEGVPKVAHDMRTFYLLHGPLGAYGHFNDDPSYWWPEDRAWCLCTDTDFSSSYMAGTRERIDELLAMPILDALEAKPENPARSGMDVINDPDGVIPRS